MRDITELMNAYRECSRNLWNVYFSRREDIGGSLDVFEQIRELLFDSLILDKLSYEGEAEQENMPPPLLRVVPRRESSLILIQRLSGPGEAGYWDQEKDMTVGPRDITLAFVDYFDFKHIPIKDFHYYRCKVLSFPSHANYEGREALIEVSDARSSGSSGSSGTELGDRRNVSYFSEDHSSSLKFSPAIPQILLDLFSGRIAELLTPFSHP